jgi:hypothetical protein
MQRVLLESLSVCREENEIDDIFIETELYLNYEW